MTYSEYFDTLIAFTCSAGLFFSIWWFVSRLKIMVSLDLELYVVFICLKATLRFLSEIYIHLLNVKHMKVEPF